jgi:uncharacterized protein YegP (UPF0339 family)
LIKYKVGTKAFIIESNKIIRNVVITNYVAGFYTVKFEETNGAIKVKESRLYDSKEAAQKTIEIKEVPAKQKTIRSPYRFLW